VSNIRILSTKKLQSNQKQFLLNAGFSVVEADFIAIKYKEVALTDINDNLIFTSINAVKAVDNHQDVQQIRRKPCFCVGEKTAALLDQVGFTVMEIANDASGLAKTIGDKYKDETFTFFSGNIRMETLPLSLKTGGITFNEKEVYDTILVPQEIKTSVDGILFFSPSGVESYLSKNSITSQTCFCIGDTTAKALEGKTKNITIANKPSVENVIVQCINHYKA
jgi:uroporphyrinogen-III synthase